MDARYVVRDHKGRVSRWPDSRWRRLWLWLRGVTFYFYRPSSKTLRKYNATLSEIITTRPGGSRRRA